MDEIIMMCACGKHKIEEDEVDEFMKYICKFKEKKDAGCRVRGDIDG